MLCAREPNPSRDFAISTISGCRLPAVVVHQLKKVAKNAFTMVAMRWKPFCAVPSVCCAWVLRLRHRLECQSDFLSLRCVVWLSCVMTVSMSSWAANFVVKFSSQHNKN
jgi:hypothetical protein